MKLAALTFAALVLATSIASAACPTGSKYQCSTNWLTGKVVCGCY
jgi:hypothetical protein